MDGNVPHDPNFAVNERFAAEVLDVSVRTMQSWRVRGCGPRYVKQSRLVRYRWGDLLEFQELNAVNSTTEADAKRQR
jgi:hypothetical protein